MLVVLVIILFLQTWRAAIIPIVAIPVSLIGYFFVMAHRSASRSTICTLFGLVLAIGIVVDDAIVVVENVERYLRQGMSPARGRAQDHGRGRRRADCDRVGTVRGVHPDRFHHRHFGLVLPSSLPSPLPLPRSSRRFVSLTLSPALAALLLKPHDRMRRSRTLAYRLGAPFDYSSPASTGRSSGCRPAMAGWCDGWLRIGVIMLVVYAGLIGLTYLPVLDARRPASSRNSIAAISSPPSQLPPGASPRAHRCGHPQCIRDHPVATRRRSTR